MLIVVVLTKNKFAQSNLERGPRRGTVAHVRRKVPIGYNGAPQIRPQKQWRSQKLCLRGADPSGRDAEGAEWGGVGSGRGVSSTAD